MIPHTQIKEQDMRHAVTVRVTREMTFHFDAAETSDAQDAHTCLRVLEPTTAQGTIDLLMGRDPALVKNTISVSVSPVEGRFITRNPDVMEVRAIAVGE
jgi:hypothetical protein